MKKALKVIVIIVVVIIAIPLIAALFIKKDYAVEREIVINKPDSTVYDYVKYLKNQDNFSVWVMRDPGMNKEYRGTDGTVGFVTAWDSQMDEVGKGEQEIIAMEDRRKIDYELRFIKPFEAKDHAYIELEKLSDNSTKVKWGFDGTMKYPMNFMLAVMNMDEMLGKDLQKGLDNLKSIVEKAE